MEWLTGWPFPKSNNVGISSSPIWTRLQFSRKAITLPRNIGTNIEISFEILIFDCAKYRHNQISALSIPDFLPPPFPPIPHDRADQNRPTAQLNIAVWFSIYNGVFKDGEDKEIWDNRGGEGSGFGRIICRLNPSKTAGNWRRAARNDAIFFLLLSLSPSASSVATSAQSSKHIKYRRNPSLHSSLFPLPSMPANSPYADDFLFCQIKGASEQFEFLEERKINLV